MRALLATLSVVALCTGTSCGGGGGEEPPIQHEVPPSVGSCTGPVPENATLCPGTDTGLSADASRVVTPYCQTTPCSYACNAGYVVANGSCEPVSPPDAIQFVDNGDGTVSVTDRFGTAVWLRNAHCLEKVGGVDRSGGAVLWTEAKAWAAGLGSGACGLTDGSTPGDWTLPLADQALV
jgi:hypothetical protein